MRLIARYARELDPSPSPAEVREVLGVKRPMWHGWMQHSDPAVPPPGMTIDHAQRIARYTHEPLSDVLVTAALRTPAETLYDAQELAKQVEQAAAAARRELGATVLRLVQTETIPLPGFAAPSVSEQTGNITEGTEGTEGTPGPMASAAHLALVHWMQQLLLAAGVSSVSPESAEAVEATIKERGGGERGEVIEGAEGAASGDGDAGQRHHRGSPG